jgi:hypothetical protein
MEKPRGKDKEKEWDDRTASLLYAVFHISSRGRSALGFASWGHVVGVVVGAGGQFGLAADGVDKVVPLRVEPVPGPVQLEDLVQIVADQRLVGLGRAQQQNYQSHQAEEGRDADLLAATAAKKLHDVLHWVEASLADPDRVPSYI